MHYQVKDGEIEIFGSSQEPLPGRRWQDYLNAFIELKEFGRFKAEGQVYSLMHLTNYFNSEHIVGLIALTGSLEDGLAKEIYPDAKIIHFTNKLEAGKA